MHILIRSNSTYRGLVHFDIISNFLQDKGPQSGNTLFKKSMLNQASLQDSLIAAADFTGSSMEMAQLAGAKIVDSIMEKVNLTYADMSHVVISGSSFSDANLFMAKMHEVSEDKTVWSGSNKAQAQTTDETRQKAEQWGK